MPRSHTGALVPQAHPTRTALIVILQAVGSVVARIGALIDPLFCNYGAATAALRPPSGGFELD